MKKIILLFFCIYCFCMQKTNGQGFESQPYTVVKPVGMSLLYGVKTGDYTPYEDAVKSNSQNNTTVKSEIDWSTGIAKTTDGLNRIQVAYKLTKLGEVDLVKGVKIWDGSKWVNAIFCNHDSMGYFVYFSGKNYYF